MYTQNTIISTSTRLFTLEKINWLEQTQIRNMKRKLPLTWVSRCEAAYVGGPDFFPGLIAKILPWKVRFCYTQRIYRKRPIASTLTLHPSPWTVATNQSRTLLSASLNAKRRMPTSVGSLDECQWYGWFYRNSIQGPHDLQNLSCSLFEIILYNLTEQLL